MEQIVEKFEENLSYRKSLLACADNVPQGSLQPNRSPEAGLCMSFHWYRPNINKYFEISKQINAHSLLHRCPGKTFTDCPDGIWIWFFYTQIPGMRVIADNQKKSETRIQIWGGMLKRWHFHLLANPWSYRFQWAPKNTLPSAREVDQRAGFLQTWEKITADFLHQADFKSLNSDTSLKLFTPHI